MNIATSPDAQAVENQKLASEATVDEQFAGHLVAEDDLPFLRLCLKVAGLKSGLEYVEDENPEILARCSPLPSPEAFREQIANAESEKAARLNLFISAVVRMRGMSAQGGVL